MKMLLTDSGVLNDSIRDALLDLLGKPFADCAALAIPTASYGHPHGTPAGPYKFITGAWGHQMVDLAWKSVGILELSALPSLDPARWQGWVDAADVLVVDGGDALYLAHWMRASGLLEHIKDRDDLVWLSLSAGSMVMTPRIGADFVGWQPADPAAADPDGAGTLGLVDFSIFPHLDHPSCPENTTAAAEQWATTIGGKAYATDNQTAFRVVDGKVEIISEGRYLSFNTP